MSVGPKEKTFTRREDVYGNSYLCHPKEIMNSE